MHPSLTFDPDTGQLYSVLGTFDPVRGRWRRHTGGRCRSVPIDVGAAARLVLANTAAAPPVAVIGPRSASPEQLETAEILGRRLAEIGFAQITGGKGGVMEAAARGARQAHGLTIGILPDNHWSGANPHIVLPIATGLGSARNAVVARAAFALVAVGGEFGTLSEMALGLHFGRLVLTLCDSPSVKGATAAASVEDAVSRVCERFLALDQTSTLLASTEADDGER